MTKNRLEFTIECLLFLLIFLFTIRPVANYDFWFHLLEGERIVSTKQLSFSDDLSHSAFGSRVVPHTWLAEVIYFIIHRLLGVSGIQFLTATLALTSFFILRQLLYHLFQLTFLPRLFLTASAYLLIFDFWVERPQALAYTLFISTLYLLITREIHSQISMLRISNFDHLFLILPLIWIWANLHASFFLGLYLILAFLMTAFLRFLVKKRQEDKQLVRLLLVIGFLAFLITLLPPLKTSHYQMLWHFFDKRDFISHVIDEWFPLWIFGKRYFLYLTLTLSCFTISLYSIFRQKKFWESSLLLPLLPLILTPFLAVRNLPFGSVGLILVFGFVWSLKKPVAGDKPMKNLISGVSIILLFSLLSLWYRNQVTTIKRGYPNQAIDFIKHNLKGNMFNEYAMGGYLLYRLYPTHRVFLDGRTDLYLPKVLPDYIGLGNQLYINTQAFQAYWNMLVRKYQLSYAILPRDNHEVLVNLGTLLAKQPDWFLVYQDTQVLIFIRDDGKNQDTLKKYARKI